VLARRGVLATGFARLEDGDLDEIRQTGPELVPDPSREDFARRVLETRDVVEVTVVEPVVNGRPDFVEDAEIDEPAGVRVHRAKGGDLDLERMAVEPCALVPFGDLWKPMSGLEAELVYETNRMRIHGAGRSCGVSRPTAMGLEVAWGRLFG
jgi:hypothetical protein